MPSSYPHLTVATVVQRGEQFLLVQEFSNGELVYNQPAGHVEPGESLIEAALRETLEETAWDVELQGIIGLSKYIAPSNGVSYHRTTFIAKPLLHHSEQALDDGIVDAVWMNLDEMRANESKMRSPLVIKSVEQYLSGSQYPLEIIY
ncbi:MAG: NUDIX hydrolase [Pseudomonadales bacterium]